MALSSPGVQVTVVDESFYTPAAPGTVPLIFVATAQDKANSSGTGTAQGTLKANAGKVWLITSQRDLSDTFGTPVFYTDASGNPVHGGELNEYGLQATYSLLGVSSRAYVTRADVDLASLVPQSSIPEGSPVDGTYWLDTSNTKWGVFEWNAVTGIFTNKTPTVIDNTNKIAATVDGYVPKPSFGTNGSYAMVATSNNQNTLWYKNTSGNWVQVGSNNEAGFTSSSSFSSTSWQTSWPVTKATLASPDLTDLNGQEIKVNGQTITLSGTTIGALATSINTAMRTHGVGAKVSTGGYLELYADATAKSNGATADGKVKLEAGSTGTLLTEAGLTISTSVSAELFQGPHTKYPDFTTAPTGSIYVKTTSPNNGASWYVKLYSSINGSFSLQQAPIFADAQTAVLGLDATSGGLNIPVGSLYVKQNATAGVSSTSTAQLVNFEIERRSATGATIVTSVATTATVSTTSTFSIKEGLLTSTNGVANYSSLVTISLAPGATVDDIITTINAAGLTYVTAVAATSTVDGDATSLRLEHSQGGEIRLTDGTGTPLASFLGFVAGTTKNLYAAETQDPLAFTFRASNWKKLVYESKATAPFSTPADGQLWYSSVVDQADIMVHDGSAWKGYRNVYPDTDPLGPIVSSLAPTTQQDGTTSLADGDIWVSTADIETYGKDVYVWNGNTLKWVAQDTADQTSPTGWVFADARWAANGYTAEPADIADLLTTNFVDPDAPDPALYPRGTRLFNLRRSGFNVKKYVVEYININANDGKNTRFGDETMDGSGSTTPYLADRWISVSPNNEDGTGKFGRHAQRGFVVAGLKAQIDANQSIRDTDSLVFNLIAAPGYPEAIQNMIAFNVDRGQTAFVVGDTPFRLKPNGTDLTAWGLNSNLAYDNGDTGGVSYDEYMAMFYPSGYTNDNFGNYIVVPPSHMMLRTIATSDAKSYQWFAPAGTRRGGVDNATSVGYLVDGEFKTTALPQSLRDVLASVKINPIATLTGAGIVNFGQYTRAKNASSLDRINVARLVAYLRRQLSLLVKPYLFEPNDALTRGEIKNAVESLMLELVAQRGLYDFIVVCDESNNTPARIDRSELYVDIAIEPVKAVEFIYIPLRLKNTGDIKAGL